jgi:hypothetical protein
MVGINNNYAGPSPTFGGTGNANYAGNSGAGPSSPFSSGDNYTVEKTSNAFDDAMAKLTGKNVFSPQSTGQTTTQSPPAGVTQEEMNWALALEQKVQNEKYTPNAQETAAYQAIAAKMAAGKSSQPAVTGATQEEVTWALALEKKVKTENYTPNAQETAAYQNIAAKLAASKSGQPSTAPATSGATQQEIDWALALEKKVKSENYTPNAQETAAYQAIAAKLAAAKSQTSQTAQTTQAPPAGATQQEIDWALALEQKVKTQNYQPNAQETAAYQAIAKKLTAGNTAQNPAQTAAKPVTQQEIDWALAIEQKVKTQNYQPTPQETATYQDIAHRLQAAKGAPNTTASSDSRDWAAWSQPFTVPRTLFQTAPRIIQVPSTLRSVVPTLPTYTVANVGPNLNTANTNTVKSNVSQQEIDWALDLEKKVKGGYNPNESELYQYKNIADRLQAQKGNNPPASLPQQTGSQLPNSNNQPAKSTGLGDRIKNAWSALTK